MNATERMPRFLNGWSLSKGNGFRGPCVEGLETKDQGLSCVVMDGTDRVFVVAMNVAIKHGHIVVRGEDVHDVVAVTGEPLPVRA